MSFGFFPKKIIRFMLLFKVFEVSCQLFLFSVVILCLYYVFRLLKASFMVGFLGFVLRCISAFFLHCLRDFYLLLFKRF